jgi:hypothetical protein
VMMMMMMMMMLPDHVDIKALSDKMWYCHMNEFDPL